MELSNTIMWSNKVDIIIIIIIIIYLADWRLGYAWNCADWDNISSNNAHSRDAEDKEGGKQNSHDQYKVV